MSKLLAALILTLSANVNAQATYATTVSDKGYRITLFETKEGCNRGTRRVTITDPTGISHGGCWMMGDPIIVRMWGTGVGQAHWIPWDAFTLTPYYQKLEDSRKAGKK